MAGAITFGLAEGGFGDEASAIWALPWGKVSLIDLYVGLAMFGGWIAYRERSFGRTIIWWGILAVLGNLAAGMYLVQASFRSQGMAELLLGMGTEHR